MTRTVLLVEDNAPSRDALTRRLARRGFQVIGVEDGEQAIARARTEQPHIILMDLGLPHVDGWEATRVLKNDPTTRHIPIIVLSAHAMTNDRDTAMSAGGDAFAPKPIHFDQLLQKIEALVSHVS